MDTSSTGILDDLLNDLEDETQRLRDFEVARADGPLPEPNRTRAINTCATIRQKCTDFQNETGRKGAVDKSNRPTTLSGQADRIAALITAARLAASITVRDGNVATVKWYCEDTTVAPSRIIEKIRSGSTS